MLLAASWTSAAMAQPTADPWAPQPPFGAPGAQPGQPGGQPGAGQPGPAPGPGQPGQPVQPGAAPGSFGGEASAGGQVAPGQFGGAGASATGQFGGPPPSPNPKGSKDEDAWKARQLSLITQNGLSGGTGLLRTSFAGSGAAGTFRVGFVADWYTSSAFLCDPDESTEAGVPITCSGRNDEDSASHVGGFFSLNATPLSFLEAYAALRTYANSNDQGRPGLLQVLGDTTFGVKGFTPEKLLGPMQVGAEAQLLLLNGAGDVGPVGGATSALFRINGTFDARQIKKNIPIRINLNLGYKVDNSGAAVEAIEIARAQAFNDGRDRQPISRIERYGLGINRVDFFQTYLGVEVPFSFIQPFVEYTVDIPVNRQDYSCYTNRVSRGDVCLGLVDLSDQNSGSPGYAAIPSRIGIGTRVSPFQAISGTEGFRGLSALVGVEIGLSATSTFVEEIAPEAPWTLYLGLGYAFDTKQKPVEKVVAPPQQPVTVPAAQSFVRGFVHEQGKQEGVPNAIVAFQGGAQPPLATGADGRFLSRHVEPGQYTFEVTAAGFKPGTCTATVNAPAPSPTNIPGLPPQLAASIVQPSAPAFTDIDCPLEALPRTGNVEGQVKDATSGNAISGAVITITDALGKDHKVTADGTGKFKAEALPPGDVSMRSEASGYMNNVSSSEVRPNESARPTISMNKRPKTALVKVQGNEIKLSDKILFEVDSAKILGQSSALLEEVAEVMQKNPNIEQVEIQGHTDNTGGREHNQKLSDARASSVRDWLIKAGVASGRLMAKGYGQDRPLAPNVTEANRTKNRRVQFIITKKR
ncbi:MAG: OmpA family protein [Polyangiaceae bacterium]|nr:OmpA family protein [Polyangiaceae bacterium]